MSGRPITTYSVFYSYGTVIVFFVVRKPVVIHQSIWSNGLELINPQKTWWFKKYVSHILLHPTANCIPSSKRSSPYLPVLWSHPGLQKLQLVPNKAVHLLMGTSTLDHIISILNELHGAPTPIPFSAHFKVLIVTYSIQFYMAWNWDTIFSFMNLFACKDQWGTTIG